MTQEQLIFFLAFTNLGGGLALSVILYVNAQRAIQAGRRELARAKRSAGASTQPAFDA